MRIPIRVNPAEIRRLLLNLTFFRRFLPTQLLQRKSLKNRPILPTPMTVLRIKEQRLILLIFQDFLTKIFRIYFLKHISIRYKLKK